MTEPADKEDVKVLVTKLDKLGDSIEGMRSQNSAEHGSLYGLMEACATGISWIKAAWRRFSILPAPPADPPKDDTQ